MALIKELEVFYRPWFDGAPKNAKRSSVTLDFTAEEFTIIAPVVGPDGDVYTVTIVDGADVDLDPVVSVVGTDLTITLGTDGLGDPDDTKNTAAALALLVEAEGFEVEVTSAGAFVVEATAETAFDGGQYATPAKASQSIIEANDGNVYVAVHPVDKLSESGWYSVTLTAL